LKITGAGSGLTFPDGTTQTTAGNPAGVVGVNPLQVALLKGFPAYRWGGTAFKVGRNPTGVAFDRTYIWVANGGDDTVTELTLSGGTAGTYSLSCGAMGSRTGLLLTGRVSEWRSIV